MRDFWKQYPQDEELFDQQVKKGIVFTLPLNYQKSPSLLLRQYGGCSADKMKRYLPLWLENRENFLLEHPKAKPEWMERFEIDYANDLLRIEREQLTQQQFLQKEESDLPVPPGQYKWINDPGATNAYRLWHDKYRVLWMDHFQIGERHNTVCFLEFEDFLNKNPDLFKGTCSPLDAARIVRKNNNLSVYCSLTVEDGALGGIEESYGKGHLHERKKTCWAVIILDYPLNRLGGGHSVGWVCKKTGEMVDTGFVCSE